MSFWDLVQEFGWATARWYLLGCAVVLLLCVAWSVWYVRKRP